MRLYMVRHGETDWNKAKKVQGRADIPLNAYGRELAEKQQKDCGGFLLIWRIHPLYPEQKKQHRLFYRGERLP